MFGTVSFIISTFPLSNHVTLINLVQYQNYISKIKSQKMLLWILNLSIVFYYNSLQSEPQVCFVQVITPNSNLYVNLPKGLYADPEIYAPGTIISAASGPVLFGFKISTDRLEQKGSCKIAHNANAWIFIVSWLPNTDTVCDVLSNQMYRADKIWPYVGFPLVCLDTG